MSVRTRDRLGALLLLGFVGVLWVQRDYLTPFGGIFPDRVMIILAALLLLDLVLSFTPYASLKEEKSEEKRIKTYPVKMAVVTVSLFLWVGLIKYFGFALSSIVVFTGISWYLADKRRKIKTVVNSILVAVALTLLIVVVFEKILLVPLPKGELLSRHL